MERKNVYAVIDGERAYQDIQAGEWNHKGVPTIEAEILLMEEYLTRARTSWVTSSNRQLALDNLRKVVGVGIRCFEHHTVPSRTVKQEELNGCEACNRGSHRAPDEYDSLQARIAKLESAADLDGDGLVTKKELQEYAAKELNMKDSEILMLRAEKTRLEEELSATHTKHISELEAAAEKAAKWKDAYDALHIRHEAYLEMVAKEKEEGCEPPKTISNKAVEQFVDELLADPNINIYLLPDKIERPLYVNFLKVLLSILQKLFNNANLDLIGHEFKVRMQPTLESRLEEGEKEIPE